MSAAQVVSTLPFEGKEEETSPQVDTVGKTDLDLKKDSADNEEHYDDAQYVKGEPVIRNGEDVSRFIVSTRDDGDSALTFRAIFLGTCFTIFSSIVTMIYVFKPLQQGVRVSDVFIMLLVYISGNFWARLTPKPERFSNKTVQKVASFLNLGQPFRLKEHVVASLIASSGNNGLTGVEVFAVERLYYGRTVSATVAVLAIFSICLCGFVLAGLLRRICIYPSELVYWTSLPQVVLFQSLHFDLEKNKKRIQKFAYFFAGSAVWEIFPSYIVPWLNGMSIFCLASIGAPASTRSVFRTIFGGAYSNQGLGLLNFTFDWQYIQSYYMSLPLKQQANAWAGYGIWYVVMLALYYGNAWNAKNFPFMSTSLFTAEGERWPLGSVFGSDVILDRSKLEEVGLPHLTATTVWGYMTNIMAVGALITHVILFYGKDVVKAFKQAKDGTQTDPHYVAMRKYKEVPLWWYGVIFVLAFFAGIIVTVRPDTTLPAWGYVISLILGAIIAPFSCFLYGLFGTGVDTSTVSKMVAGAIHPGKPLANLYFACWSHNVIVLTVNLSNWLKVGQYTKVPHRVMFATQVYASLLGAAFNYLMMDIIVKNQKDVLLNVTNGNAVWSGAQIASMNTKAVTWALAKDIYSAKSEYFIVPISILIGMAVPVVHFVLAKYYPKLRNYPIVTPIIITYMGQVFAGATTYITSSIAVGILSQIVLRKRFPGIYRKYNYLLGAALDGGAQTVIFILSFIVFGAAGKARPFPTWFGNPLGSPDHCSLT